MSDNDTSQSNDNRDDSDEFANIGPVDVLENDLRNLQQERDRLFEQLARTQADFRNAQKRLEADKQQAIQYANSRLISSLLPVIDNFERSLAIDPAKSDVNTLLKGLQITYDQLMTQLRQQNIDPIAPEPGTPFDPNLHQAILQQPTDKYDQPTVTQLLQKGYQLHGRVLRPAQVAVSQLS
jgi:molecular chaperone GrpE